MTAPPLGGLDAPSGPRARYLAAPTFEAMLGTVTKNVELWTAMWRHARVDDDYVRRVSSLPGSWHLLVLSEDWCGDALTSEGDFGHAVFAVNGGFVWSNDILRRGHIDRVRWDVFPSRWRLPYRGWISACRTVSRFLSAR